jgi:hypothetical protein
MKADKLGRLIRQNLRRNRKNFVFSAVGIVAGISSFVFFVALGSGIKRVIATEIFPLEANRIQVVPPAAQFDAWLPGRALDDEALGRLARIPGVTAVYPRMKLAIPSTMTLLGSEFPPEELARVAGLPGVTPAMVEAVKKLQVWMEIMADGIDPRLVKGDAAFGEFADPAPGRPIPVLLSKRLVEIYNSSFAKTRSLPPISEVLIPYVPSLPLTLNESYIDRGLSGPRLQVRIKIVGTSFHALLGGVTMPLDTVRRLPRELTVEAPDLRHGRPGGPFLGQAQFGPAGHPRPGLRHRHQPETNGRERGLCRDPGDPRVHPAQPSHGGRGRGQHRPHLFHDHL